MIMAGAPPCAQVWCACSRLHYVTHRLALGVDGIKELVATEKRLLGRSEFADSSNLAVFAVPTMAFEESRKNGPNSQHMQDDEVVRRHIEVRIWAHVCDHTTVQATSFTACDRWPSNGAFVLACLCCSVPVPAGEARRRVCQCWQLIHSAPRSLHLAISVALLISCVVQRMDTYIEKFRTEKMREVTMYPGHLSHTARLRSFARMRSNAAALSPGVQQLIADAVEASRTIVNQNPASSMQPTASGRMPSCIAQLLSKGVCQQVPCCMRSLLLGALELGMCAGQSRRTESMTSAPSLGGRVRFASSEGEAASDDDDDDDDEAYGGEAGGAKPPKVEPKRRHSFSRRLSELPHDLRAKTLVAGSLEHLLETASAVEAPENMDGVTPGITASQGWQKVREGVSAMAERCGHSQHSALDASRAPRGAAFILLSQSIALTTLAMLRWRYVDKHRKRSKKQRNLHLSDLLDNNNMMALCRGVVHPAASQTSGIQVYNNKCRELGVVPNSRIVEMMDMVRLSNSAVLQVHSCHRCISCSVVSSAVAPVPPRQEWNTGVVGPMASRCLALCRTRLHVLGRG